MVTIGSLWLAIVLAAVAVFIVSSVIHMVLTYHRSDYGPLPDEDRVREALKEVPPGQYTVPHCASPKEMGSPEKVALYEQGPVGHLTLMPSGVPAMGKFLGQWLLYCLVVSLFMAYLAGRSLAPEAEFRTVFRFVAVLGFLAYGMGQFQNMIWKSEKASTTAKHVFDGLVYGLVSGAVFGWMWP